MKKISNDEHKKILIKMLDYLHKLCIENDIKYTLMGGSLIGAIREGGIIPWDDDIDIALDVKNYQKLVKALSDNNSQYKLINYDLNNSYYLPFDKLIDTNTKAVELGRREIDNYGIFVDIFVYHNVPNNKFLAKMYYSRLKLYQNLIFGYSKTDPAENKNIIKKIRKKVAEIIGIKHIIKKYNKILNKYDKKDTEELICSWPLYPENREMVKKDWIKKFETAKFDGIDAMISSDYDAILTRSFGDYMTPPPKDERVMLHNMEMFLKEQSSLISCIITTYKRPVDVLKRAIDSVLNQTYKNIELFVVNDCPEDKKLAKQIEKLINSYKKTNLKYICLEKNSGACFARNKGAEYAKGEYLAFLDDDDEWLPTKLEKQIEKFDDPKVGLVYCDNYIVQGKKKKHHIQKNPNRYENDYKQILDENYIGGVSFPMIKRSCFVDVGGFDKNVPSSQDTDLYIRIIKKYKAVKCDEPLLNYYISDVSITTNTTKKLNGYNYILDKYKNDFKKYPDVLMGKYIAIGNSFTVFGEFKIATDFYKKARKLGASRFKIIKNKYICYLRFIKRKMFK